MKTSVCIHAGLIWLAGMFAAAGDLTIPLPVSPATNATNVSASATLQVNTPAAGSRDLTVKFYGRLAESPGPDFTIVALPDTQFYSASMNGGSPAMFNAQIGWCVSNRVSRNIVYVTHLGDIVENGDTNAGAGASDQEWANAAAALYQLENPATTGLAEGIPYGVDVGNHDESPEGTPPPKGATTHYNQYFGASHFAGRSYYGGHYGTNGDNHYELFSASGLDFISVSMGYDTSANPAVLSWANSLLQTYSNRCALVSSHYIGNDTTPATFGVQGAAIYNALRTNANLFLMVCGHKWQTGEGSRTDTFNGHSATTLVSDYQGYTNGGNGFMRIMQFSPASNMIQVTTYSPWTGQSMSNGLNQFQVPMTMPPAMPASNTNFNGLGANLNVAPGAATSVTWAGLLANHTYQWYVTVTDASNNTAASPVWQFTTQATQLTAPVPIQGGNCALQFDGVSSYVDISSAVTGFTNVGDFTICGWFNIHNAGALQYLFRITDAESNTRRIQLTESNGLITADIRPTASGTIYAVTTSAYSYSNWVHIAFLRSGSQLLLYLNGQQASSQTAIAGTFPANKWAFLGANPYNNGSWGVPANFFAGIIDEFQIWTNALGISDIQKNMYQPIIPAPGLVAGWGFNEGAGNLAYDSSGHNLTATVYNANWVTGPSFSISQNGTYLILTWGYPNAQLDSSEDAAGPWSAVRGANSPYSVDTATNLKQFFRLQLGD
jgi:hypothetical protein